MDFKNCHFGGLKIQLKFNAVDPISLYYLFLCGIAKESEYAQELWLQHIGEEAKLIIVTTKLKTGC